jgi:hypothetical protein
MQISHVTPGLKTPATAEVPVAASWANAEVTLALSLDPGVDVGVESAVDTKLVDVEATYEADDSEQGRRRALTGMLRESAARANCDTPTIVVC